MLILVIFIIIDRNKISNAQVQLRKQQVALKQQQAQIQNQRRESILNDCKDQNTRHDNTINFLNSLAKKIEKQHPDKKAAVESSLKQDYLLINALAPKQDCLALVKESVPSDKKPIPSK